MKRSLCVYLNLTLLFLTFSNCKKETFNECIKGKVIDYQYCYNVNIIEVLSDSKVGSSIELNGVQYTNAIQTPGGKIDESIIFLYYRPFNPEKDPDFENIVCPTNLAPLTLPKFIIVEYSNSNCNAQYEK